MSEKKRRRNKKYAIIMLVVGLVLMDSENAGFGLLLCIVSIVILLRNRKKKTQAQKPESVSKPEYKIAVDIKPSIEFKNAPIKTFEQSKKECFPSSNGLYPAEILLIEYSKNGNYPMESQNYPGFWWYRYGVHDVNLLLSSLEKRGFICYISATEMLPKLTVSRLKELLTFFNLPLSGRKADLVKRLTDNVLENNLREQIPERRYTPTALGFREVAENQYVVYFHRSSLSDITVWRMNELVHNNPLEDWTTLLWDELASVKERYYVEKRYGLYRCICLQQYYFAMEYSTLDDSFYYLAETLYLDLNEKKISLNTEELEHCIAPGLIKYLSDLRNRMRYDESTLINNLMCVFGKIGNKNSYLTDLQTAEIISAYVFGHPETIKKP